MNLHSIAVGYVSAVNPLQACSVQISNGYTTNPDGTRVPAYQPAVTIQGQVQALTYKDLIQTEGLNLQGSRYAIYLYGDIEAIVRADNKGGDLITLPNGQVYLVAQVLEHWFDGPSTSWWCKVVATLQNGS